MMIPKNMHSKTVAILGLGISGIAAKESLIKAGSKLYMYDDLHNLKNLKNCKITHPLKWPWESLDEIIVSPGIIAEEAEPVDSITERLLAQIHSAVESMRLLIINTNEQLKD